LTLLRQVFTIYRVRGLVLGSADTLKREHLLMETPVSAFVAAIPPPHDGEVVK